MARLVLEETGLLPHLNPGVMDSADLRRLRPVSASMGLMLESASNRLCERGGAHFGSPDKLPAKRLATLLAAGELGIPMTTGLLIGIGETRRERIESLLALRAVHERHGHLQELIIQNFRAKPGTKMAGAPEPALEEQLWTIAVARLLFGPSMSIQAPPNLRPEALDSLVRAGINDWGGVSPVTPDHVNPEAPWPHLTDLAGPPTRRGGSWSNVWRWCPPMQCGRSAGRIAAITPRVRRLSDSRGFARPDRWYAGWAASYRRSRRAGHRPSAGVRSLRIRPVKPMFRTPAAAGRCTDAARQRAPGIKTIIEAASAGHALSEAHIVRLFSVEGRDLDEVIARGGPLRRETVGDTVTYVVNRNINYTNICLYHCGFCAFSKGRGQGSARSRLQSRPRGDCAPHARGGGAPARPRSACRGAFIRTSRATPISTSCVR